MAVTDFPVVETVSFQDPAEGGLSSLGTQDAVRVHDPSRSILLLLSQLQFPDHGRDFRRPTQSHATTVRGRIGVIVLIKQRVTGECAVNVSFDGVLQIPEGFGVIDLLVVAQIEGLVGVGTGLGQGPRFGRRGFHRLSDERIVQTGMGGDLGWHIPQQSPHLAPDRMRDALARALEQQWSGRCTALVVILLDEFVPFTFPAGVPLDFHKRWQP